MTGIKLHLVACRTIQHRISRLEDAQQLWNKLEEIYQPSNPQNKMMMDKRLSNLKFKDGGSMAEHLSNFQEIADLMLASGMSFDDETQAIKLQDSLPSSWETMVITLSNNVMDKLEFERVANALLQEEDWCLSNGSHSKRTFAVTEHKGNFRKKSHNIYKKEQKQSGQNHKE